MPLTRTADGAEIYWETQGAGETLLFIAGQAMSHRGWLNITDQFTPHFRVILMDHRGIGNSTEGRTENYTTSLFAEDALQVIADVGAERAHVYGFSMGGRIAQELALKHPNRVGKVILGATTAGNGRGKQRSADASKDLFSGDWRRLAPHFFSATFIEQHPDRVKDFFRTDAAPETLKKHYFASKLHDAWDRLPNMEPEALILHGALDDLTPVENAELMAELIPNVRLEIIPDGLHGYFVESQLATDIALEFLLS